MIKSEIQLRVRYSETDKMGYIYYGNYAQYYEIARTEMMRGIGLPYSKLEERGILMPVISLNIRYLIPSFYDDTLLIKTFVKEKPLIRIRFDYEIYNENKELVNIADTTLVFIEAHSRKPKRPPQVIVQLFDKYF
jgi:acyl-CoA thioester hydrolase